MRAFQTVEDGAKWPLAPSTQVPRGDVAAQSGFVFRTASRATRDKTSACPAFSGDRGYNFEIPRHALIAPKRGDKRKWAVQLLNHP